MKPSTLRIKHKIKSIAKGLDKKIEKIAGERIAFTLIIYTDERASYVSTCKRSEAIEQMEFLLACWRKGMPDTAAHESQ